MDQTFCSAFALALCVSVWDYHVDSTANSLVSIRHVHITIGLMLVVDAFL